MVMAMVSLLAVVARMSLLALAVEMHL